MAVFLWMLATLIYGMTPIQVTVWHGTNPCHTIYGMIHLDTIYAMVATNACHYIHGTKYNFITVYFLTVKCNELSRK